MKNSIRLKISTKVATVKLFLNNTKCELLTFVNENDSFGKLASRIRLFISLPIPVDKLPRLPKLVILLFTHQEIMGKSAKVDFPG